MNISRYVIVDALGGEDDEEVESFQEARRNVEDYHSDPVAIMKRTYVYGDSELVWTTNGEDTWPPAGEASK